jgi:hypothetical protein
MTIKIYNQWNTPECKGYWFLTALKILNPSIDDAKVIAAINEDYKGLMTNRTAWEFFKSRGFIKEWRDIWRSILLKGRLNRWIPIVANIGGIDWEATNTPPFIAKVSNRIWAHSVTAVGFDNKTRLIKVANTWGTWWGDNWFYYIHADDLDRLTNFCELII